MGAAGGEKQQVLKTGEAERKGNEEKDEQSDQDDQDEKVVLKGHRDVEKTQQSRVPNSSPLHAMEKDSLESASQHTEV